MTSHHDGSQALVRRIQCPLWLLLALIGLLISTSSQSQENRDEAGEAMGQLFGNLAIAIQTHLSLTGELPYSIEQLTVEGIDTLAQPYFSRVSLREGAVIVMEFNAEIMPYAGTLLYAPTLDDQGIINALTCTSPDVPVIAETFPDCTYVAEQPLAPSESDQFAQNVAYLLQQIEAYQQREGVLPNMGDIPDLQLPHDMTQSGYIWTGIVDGGRLETMLYFGPGQENGSLLLEPRLNLTGSAIAEYDCVSYDIPNIKQTIPDCEYTGPDVQSTEGASLKRLKDAITDYYYQNQSLPNAATPLVWDRPANWDDTSIYEMAVIDGGVIKVTMLFASDDGDGVIGTIHHRPDMSFIPGILYDWICTSPDITNIETFFSECSHEAQNEDSNSPWNNLKR